MEKKVDAECQAILDLLGMTLDEVDQIAQEYYLRTGEKPQRLLIPKPKIVVSTGVLSLELSDDVDLVLVRS